MTGNGTRQIQDRLVVKSRLSDITQVASWIGDLASQHGVTENVEFAMNLCMEEALSNIIRHGYAGAEDRLITIQFTMPRDRYFVFVIEDEAPRFNPLDAVELPVLSPQENIRVGGQGIRFLRQFADSLEYEPTPSGNRLRVGFAAVGSAAPKEY